MDFRLFIIEIIMLVVTSLSVVVAITSTYFYYKTRTSPYREVLYSKQIGVYIKLMDAITEFFRVAHRFLVDKKEKKGENLLKYMGSSLGLEAARKRREVEHIYNKWFMVIPQKTIDLLSKFIREYETMLWDIPYDSKSFIDSYWAIVRHVRNTIGTNQLSEETIGLITELPVFEETKKKWGQF